MEILRKKLREIILKPNQESSASFNRTFDSELTKVTSALALLKRPDINIKKLLKFLNEFNYIEGLEEFNDKVSQQVEIQEKYSGYITKQKRDYLKVNDMADLPIPRILTIEQSPVCLTRHLRSLVKSNRQLCPMPQEYPG